MRYYTLTIKNNCGISIYQNTTQAEDENTALLKLLKEDEIIIYSGDIITIEEE